MFDIVAVAALPGERGEVTTPRSIDNRISEEEAIAGLLESEVSIARQHRAQLGWILECERFDRFTRDGHRGFAEWLGAKLRISEWEARRRINAAHVLPALPRVDAAFERGDLTLQKVVELCRFVTPENESQLLPWAIRVKPRTIKHKADVETRKQRKEILEIDRSRFLHYWWMEDGRLGLEGAFPPDQGGVIAKAIDRLAQRTPDIVEHDDVIPTPADAALDVRRADALYAMASTRIANDQDPDRATVVVHAPLGVLAGTHTAGCEIELGPAIDAETALRMACDARLEVVLYNTLGT